MNYRTTFKPGVLAVLASASVFGPGVLAGTPSAASTCPHELVANDHQIAIRLETAYRFNPLLNNMPINPKVRDGDVLLSGTVASDIDRDLAEEIARSIDGVGAVENNLEVREDLAAVPVPQSDVDLLQKVKDATTTAQIKTRLIGNANIAARDIDVDTENNMVRLTGEVRSDTEKQLAEFIARNTSGVESVINALEIRRSS